MKFLSVVLTLLSLAPAFAQASPVGRTATCVVDSSRSGKWEQIASQSVAVEPSLSEGRMKTTEISFPLADASGNIFTIAGDFAASDEVLAATLMVTFANTNIRVSSSNTLIVGASRANPMVMSPSSMAATDVSAHLEFGAGSPAANYVVTCGILKQ